MQSVFFTLNISIAIYGHSIILREWSFNISTILLYKAVLDDKFKHHRWMKIWQVVLENWGLTLQKPLLITTGIASCLENDGIIVKRVKQASNSQVYSIENRYIYSI